LKHQGLSLRVIAARLESDGHVTRRGTRYGSEAVARMLSLGACLNFGTKFCCVLGLRRMSRERMQARLSIDGRSSKVACALDTRTGQESQRCRDQNVSEHFPEISCVASLFRKCYFLSQERKTVRGVYLWNSRAEAETFRSRDTFDISGDAPRLKNQIS
jgi:hypothetical protein